MLTQLSVIIKAATIPVSYKEAKNQGKEKVRKPICCKMRTAKIF